MTKYKKTLTEVATVLQIPYPALYKHRHRPEFIKTERGYNVEKILNYLEEQERIKEQEEKEQNLLGAEEELLEKQVKLEHAKLKCRLLELQIKTKEGNLVEVNQVLESRTKEITRLKRGLSDMVKRLPSELKMTDEATIKMKLNEAVNNILSDIAELIIDNWIETDETELEEMELI